MTTDFCKWSPPRSGLRLLTILFCCSLLYAGVDVTSTFIDDNGNLVINGTGFPESPTVTLGLRHPTQILKFSPTQIVVAPDKDCISSGTLALFINEHRGSIPDFYVTFDHWGRACPHINVSAYDPKTKMVTFTGTHLGPPEGARCSLETDGKTIPAF